MAVEFLATVEKFSRVEAALAALRNEVYPRQQADIAAAAYAGDLVDDLFEGAPEKETGVSFTTEEDFPATVACWKGACMPGNEVDANRETRPPKNVMATLTVASLSEEGTVEEIEMTPAEYEAAYEADRAAEELAEAQGSLALDYHLSQIATAKQLAAAFSPERLTEMRKSLVAGLQRHLDAYVRGYSDALRSNWLRDQVRSQHRKRRRGAKSITIVQCHNPETGGEHASPPPVGDDPITQTIRFFPAPSTLNMQLSKEFALGNESSVRLILKPLKEKRRFYLDEIEPRGSKRKRGHSTY